MISLRVEIRISFASCYCQGAKFVEDLNNFQTMWSGVVFPSGLSVIFVPWTEMDQGNRESLHPVEREFSQIFF